MTQEVVGYAFNADMWCIECTREYCEEQLMTNDVSLEELTKYVSLEHVSLEELTSKVKDSEGNDLHAVFDIDEQIDHDAACGSYDRDKHAVIVKYANYFSHIDSILKFVKSDEIDDIYNDYKATANEFKSDHDGNDDHECQLNFYLRFNRDTGDTSSWGTDNSDGTSQPYTNSTNYVFGITACPAYIYTLDEFKDELESSVGEIYN